MHKIFLKSIKLNYLWLKISPVMHWDFMIYYIFVFWMRCEMHAVLSWHFFMKLLKTCIICTSKYLLVHGKTWAQNVYCKCWTKSCSVSLRNFLRRRRGKIPQRTPPAPLSTSLLPFNSSSALSGVMRRALRTQRTQSLSRYRSIFFCHCFSQRSFLIAKLFNLIPSSSCFVCCWCTP